MDYIYNDDDDSSYDADYLYQIFDTIHRIEEFMEERDELIRHCEDLERREKVLTYEINRLRDSQ